ncbi:related to CLC1 Clathrin light chain [Ramularia collo-cygni]|uniref:Clathrin light chain n=1 Tax=Ramularia collo-cygni TaxID=112498 RepID=A0A2D3VMS2_9PEZI|nr:related to CLC1 Clathrin light chain [Ramularia collo-cygni]CZT25179.1 related to CLC1 Clathrin light chain [Ramularia collo-cygni]
MADRFPSLDDFDAGQTEVADPTTSLSTDEPSDFLARERAALGEDAQQFTSSADQSATVADVEDDDDDDLMGGGGDFSSSNNNNNDMMGDFESSYPSISTTNEAVSAGGGTITGSTLPYQPSHSPFPTHDEDEPEVLREWRERRDLAIQHRDEVSAAKKAETVKAAQQAIDEFYENYNSKREKQVAQTRKDAEEFLAKREDTTSGGTSWERIAKLVDLSGKGTQGGAAGSGKGKMRGLLVSLRKDEAAPGAKGF